MLVFLINEMNFVEFLELIEIGLWCLYAYATVIICE